MCAAKYASAHTQHVVDVSESTNVVGVIIIIGLLLETFFPLLVLHCACGPRYATISPLFL